MRPRYSLAVICAVLLILAASPANADVFWDYSLTAHAYAYTADMDAAAIAEFGPGATVADWVDLEASFAGQAAAFCDYIGLTEYRDHAWVYWGGEGFYSSTRHYFIERHDGTVPGGWLVHDEIDNHTLCLGSWSNDRQILVRLPATTAVPESERRTTWGQIKALCF